MDNDSIPTGSDIDSVSDLLLGDDEDFDYGDSLEDTSDHNGSFGEEEPVHETAEPGVLGSERKKTNVEEIAETLEDEGLVPGGESGAGEEPETQAGMEAPPVAQPQTPATLKPVSDIGSMKEAQAMYDSALVQKGELRTAVQQLDNLLATNQISQAQHREGLLNAQSMNNSLDSYAMNLHNRAASVRTQVTESMAKERDILIKKHPDLKDPEVYKGRMNQVRNFLNENFSKEAAKNIEANVTAEQLSFLINMQKMAAGNSKNEKLLKQAARKMKSERKQQKTELVHARNPAQTSNGNLGMSNQAAKLDAIDKLLYGA